MEYIKYKINKDTSSLVSKMKWYEKTSNLHITFRTTGKEYIYKSVPKYLVTQLIDAYSIGEFFNENIKKHYEHEKVG